MVYLTTSPLRAFLVSVLLATLLSSTATAQCDPQWIQASQTGRVFHAMTYDSARGRILMYGGLDLQIRGDTWEWDGARWLARDGDGPTRTRLFSAMAHDAARGRTVLFGGHDSIAGPVGDTWEWDGGSWTQIAAAGPSPRAFHAMAYDEARGQIVLFGGALQDGPNVTYYGDTWVWDGATWMLLPTPVSPGPRSGPVMTYDRARQRVVLFGGYTDATFPGDTWEWDGTQWTQAATTGPLWRDLHAMGYDPNSQRVLLFGGSAGGNPSNDLWSWDGTAWTTITASGPSPRFAHTGVYDEARSQFVVFGGYDAGGTRLRETWTFDGSTWTDATTRTPSAELTGYRVPLAYDPIRQRAVLFSGISRIIGGACTWDTTVWEWTDGAWLPIQPVAPLEVYYSSMAFDPVNQQVMSVGGFQAIAPGACSASTGLHQSWLWDGATWTFANAGGVMGFCGEPVGLVTDSLRNRVVARVSCPYHGNPPIQGTQGIWEWDGLTWTQMAGATGPVDRWDTAMAFDPVRGRTVLFGGSTILSPFMPLGETWEWDGAAWIQIPVTGPPPREAAAMAWDPVRQRIIMHGGYVTGTGQTLDDIWAYDGTQWTLLSVSGPGARQRHAMFFDAAAQRLVVHGGNDASNTPVADTWYLSSVPLVVGNPLHAAVQTGSTAEFLVTANGFGALSYQWRKDSIPLADGPTGTGSTISGATTPTLRIAGATALDAGSYDCQVNNDCGLATSAAAQLTITPSLCLPDLTTGAIPGQPGYGLPNGVLNNEDFFFYLAAFAAGNMAVADLTTGAIPGQPGYGVPNGILNNEDFFYYLAVFAAGC